MPLPFPPISKTSVSIEAMKKKFKYIEFIDILSISIDGAVKYSKVKGIQNPILLFSFTDLQEMSEAMIQLSKTNYVQTILFIPRQYAKDVIQKNLCHPKQIRKKKRYFK